MGTDHCNSKLSENIYFEKDIYLFFQYFRKPARKSEWKGRILEGFEFRLRYTQILQ